MSKELSFVNNQSSKKQQNQNAQEENKDIVENNHVEISQSQGGLFKKFGMDQTLKNINSELHFEHKLAPEVKTQIKEKIDKFCTKRYRDLYDKEKDTNIVDYLLENRIFDLNNESASNEIPFTNHILIIGYQDNLFVLLKMLSFYFETKDICLVGNDMKTDIEIIKLLKHFNNLKYLKGDYSSPKVLIKAGIQHCYYTLILCENIDPKIKEDINNLVTFRSIEYYFSARVILELWKYESTSLLGNIPIDKKNKIIANEFLNPNFMAGKLIYLNHFEKIVVESYLDEKVSDAWLQLMQSGYRGVKEHQKTTKKVLQLKKMKSNQANPNPCPIDSELQMLNTFPCAITIEVPEFYEKKEYHFLVADLLSLDCIPMGLYLEDPQVYLSLAAIHHNTVTYDESKKSTSGNLLDVQTSSRKINNNETTSAFIHSMKMLRSVSYNNKNFLDFLDLDSINTPIFITSPSPNFILTKNTRVQVLYNYHVKDNHIHNIMQESATNVRHKESGMSKETKVSNYLQYKLKMKLLKKQEKFFSYYQSLREKYLIEYNKVISKIEGIDK